MSVLLDPLFEAPWLTHGMIDMAPWDVESILRQRRVALAKKGKVQSSRPAVMLGGIAGGASY